MLKRKDGSKAFMSRKTAFCLTGIFLFLAFSLAAYAHSVVLWCYVEGKQVHVEAFFGGGKQKVQHGKILVVDKNGKELLKGETDEKGLFSFVPPIRDDMTIALKVDSGHQTSFDLTKQDFLDADADAAAKK